MAITITRDLEALQRLRKAYREQATAIRQHKDDHLSAEGLAAEKAKRLDALRAEGKSALERIQLSVDTDRNYLKAQAETAMPNPSGSTADAWARVQMLLEAGRDLNHVVRDAPDVLTLQAIREWGPTYLESKRTVTFEAGLNGAPPADATPLLNSVGKRWAQLTGKESELSDYFNSQGGLAKYDVLAGDTGELFEGRGHSELDVQLSARAAEQLAGADLSVAESE